MNPLRLLGLMAGILCGVAPMGGAVSESHGAPMHMGAPPPPVPNLAQFGRKGGRTSNKTPKPPVPWCTKHYAAPLPGEGEPERKARMNVLKRQRKAEAANTRAHNIERDLWSAAGRRSNRTLARSADRVLRKREKAWT